MKHDPLAKTRIDRSFEGGPGPQSACFSAMAFGLYPDAPHTKVADRQPSFTVRRMSVREALEWAFGTELASLDFDEWAKVGVGTEYILMQRATLGETIDCSVGRSRPASDAELIGDAVRAALDWRDAVWVAALARSRRCPDWLKDVAQVYVPKDWSHGSRGRIGSKINASDDRLRREHGFDVDELWRRWRRSRKTGAMALQACELTPVTLYPSPAKIAQVRRTYQRWCALLLRVRQQLRSVELARVEITDDLPDAVPWVTEAREVLTE